MEVTKRIGIWMDHASAHLIEVSAEPIETKTLESKLTKKEKDTVIRNDGPARHDEQHEEAAYYKELGEVIKSYDNVLLFGPTEAKVELLNILRADHLFENIKIEVQQTDKMTEHQQHAYVRAYFSKN